MTTADNEGSVLSDQLNLAFPWAVRVAATLRLADLIASGATHLDALAAQAGADADALGRLLRYLSSRGMFAEPAPGIFTLTDPARLLLDSHPHQMRAWLDQEGAGGRLDRAWSGLLDAVRTGAPTYASLYGCSFWEDLAAHPALRASFDSLMAAQAAASAGGAALAAEYDWTTVRRVVDVGGGTGTLLAAILLAHPALHGTLLDLPTTAHAAHETFATLSLVDRCEVVAGSFFDPLPPGADVYLLSIILDDWADPEALTILRRCAEAAGPARRVLIRTGEGGGDDGDLLMLVLLGGRGRTQEEYGALADAAGMALHAAQHLSSGHLLLECVVR